MHLVEHGPLRILLDCGLSRVLGEDRPSPPSFPFDPTALTAVVVSHAHVDHCGGLPYLVRQGYRGPIYCTSPTRALLSVILMDSGRIQEENLRVAEILQRPGHHGEGRAFTRADVIQVLQQCVPVPYGEPRAIAAGVGLCFRDAGHVLGSAITTLTLPSHEREYRITFTGDLGRRGLPYLPEPGSVPESDIVVCESTYGGRYHQTAEEMAGELGEIVARTADRGGKVLIPAFSLGRTQLVVHYLRRWMGEGKLPLLPIYVDSPLAQAIAEVYDEYRENLSDAGSPDDPPAHYLSSREEAAEVSLRREPCVLVASGGMCDGGRILDHLRHHVDDPRSSIVLVSYQAPSSLGARLLERGPTVRFQGRTWNKWAEVVKVNGFSGHADHRDLLDFLQPLAGAASKVRLVHGEPAGAETLATALREAGLRDVAVPALEQTVEVG